LDLYWPGKTKKTEADLDSLVTYLRSMSPEIDVKPVLDDAGDREEFLARLTEAFKAVFDAKVNLLGPEANRFLRIVLLRVIDMQWVEQLRTMEDLREGIGLQAYGQKDPLVEYTRQGFEMFQSRIQTIEEDTVRWLFRVTVKKEGEGRTAAPAQKAPTREARPVSGQGQRTVQAKTARKVGRNDPCPCGSGLKYKHCCGKVS